MARTTATNRTTGTITVSDNFDDSSLDLSLWRASTGASAVITETTYLAITSGAANSAYIISNKPYKVRNSTIEMKVTKASGDFRLSICPHYSVSQTADCWPLGHWYSAYGVSNKLQLQKKDITGAGTQGTTVGSLSDTLTAPYWIRLRVNDTTIYCEYSTDHSTWTTVASEAWSLSHGINADWYVYISAYETPILGEPNINGFKYTGQKNLYLRPKVLLTFDDEWTEQMSVIYPIMATAGFKGTCYLVSRDVGTDGFMTAANLNTLYAAGWDMANHTATHPHMRSNTVAQNRSEISTCKTYIDSLGFTRASGHFALPYGEYDADVLSAIAAEGCLTNRTVAGGLVINSLADNTAMNCYAIAKSTSLATVKGYIDAAISAGKAVVICIHKVKASPDDEYTEWSTTNFQGLIDYLVTKKQQADVVTISEWYNWFSTSRTPATNRTLASNRTSV